MNIEQLYEKKELSKKLSVVVCSKNEEKELKCLKLIIKNKPDEIIVVVVVLRQNS